MTRSRVELSQEIDPEPERTSRQKLKENQNQNSPKDQEDMENVEGTHEEQALSPRRTMEDYVTQRPNTHKTTGSIITWEDLQKKFLGKYFPPAKTIKLRNEISQFMQEPEEHLSEAWERFNGLLKRCPNHKIELWSQIEIFYNGLNINTRSMIDAAFGGSISKKTPEEVHELIEEITANMYQYPLERSSKKAAGIYILDSSTTVQAQLDALQQQFTNWQQQSNPVVASICGICGGGHADYECQGNVYAMNSTLEQANFVGNSRRIDPYNYTYNPGWRNHPNFSWNNTNQTRQHPPRFKPLQANAQQKEEPQWEEERKMIREMYAEFQSMKTMQADVQSLKQSVTLLTTQVNQLNKDVYERPRGALPSNSEVNPKEQVKAMTLISGKTLEELQPKEQPAIEEEQNQKVEEEQGQERKKVSSPASPRRKKGKDALPITDIDVIDLPYPSRAKKDILENSFARFLEIFKNLQINIPLIEALSQIPLYGKFLKEVLSRRRKVEEQGTILLNKNCSAILRNELPAKLKDPGSFTIPCEIGSYKFANALCDLGASVNLMPLSLCKYLKLGEPPETVITLQFADRSTKIPEGIMEDVLVKIQDFIYPCDFVVLDMEVDKNLPIILGRAFLATAGAIIDVKQGNLTLRLNNDPISFNIKEAMKQPAIPHDHFCLSIDVIDSCIAEIEEEERTEEAIKGGLTHSEEEEDEDPIIEREIEELEAENKEELEEEIKEQGA
ncbi:hypothetical protein H6P81_010234 [Aristolochia fimbriata]|uniref:Retrotransposon gag domain-containing protein n=1 Tax=Aristolochia fimbriata TaxID=158543 RepID=A0AAV7EP03_ARIFI|nr:hypothetical protein H6P81_010234 [Aristolochia fimbriata]